MDDINTVVMRLLGEGCPLRTLSELLTDMDVSPENLSELENMIDVLEMHEADIRKLRQSISLKIRQHVYASFSEHLRNDKGKLE